MIVIQKMSDRLDALFDAFFHKRGEHTSHETLAHYIDGVLVPGGDPNRKKLSCYYTHINYETMKTALQLVLKQNKPGYRIVETGCAAHGTQSTLLWDKFVNAFGGSVISVDKNASAVNDAKRAVSPKTMVVHSDSMDFLPKLTGDIDFLYLDSYDVDFLAPGPSAEHHLNEFNAVKHLLHPGSVILIDDTPVSPEWLDNGPNHPKYEEYKKTFDPTMSGKGSLVSQELEKMGATCVKHQYQVLWML